MNRGAAESRVSGGRRRRRWLLSSLRQEQLQAVAGSSGHGGGGGGGGSLQTPGSGSLTAPHTPGTWEPGNRFRPSGSPPPAAAPARPASAPRLCSGGLLGKCPRCAPGPEALSAAAGPAPPRCLPSFVTRPRRRRRRRHKPAFGRVGGCSVRGAPSAQPPSPSPLPPPPSYSSSASFLPHPALHRPAPRRPRNRRLGIARRARARQLRLGSRTPNWNQSETSSACGLLPEKAERPQQPMRGRRWETTPRRRGMPKVAEQKGEWLRLVLWLAGGEGRQ